ncbi:DUF124-domain-containing protein [Powellomyces hirtus]|nr:DUF124-domain-containing protein [Powellomyces hirtus]
MYGYPAAGQGYLGYPPPAPGLPAPPGVPAPPTYPAQSLHYHTPFGPSQVGPSIGNIEGIKYEVMYRDVNSIVKLTLNAGVTVKAKTGSMVAHSTHIKLEGKLKMSNMFKSGSVAQLSLSAENSAGTVLLAPPMFSDLMVLELDGRKEYIAGDAGDILLTSAGITMSTKANSLAGAMFSGEGIAVTRLSGKGLVVLSSLGSIHPLDLASGEEYIVDNGHLVVWETTVKMTTQAAGKSLFGGLGSGEGMVCKFTGPGRIYLQTRNPGDIGAWIASHVSSHA